MFSTHFLFHFFPPPPLFLQRLFISIKKGGKTFSFFYQDLELLLGLLLDLLDLLGLSLGLLLSLSLLVGLLLLGGLVHLALGLLLELLHGLELLGPLLSLGLVIGDKDVIKDGAGLDLPDLDTDVLEGGVGVELLVLLEVGVLDHGVLPDALVGGVGDAARVPLALVLGVLDGGGLPLAVGLVVPVLGLGGVGVSDALGDVVPALGLLVLGVVHVGVVDPVGGLLGLGVLDHLGGHHVPVVLEVAVLDLDVVDAHLVGVVGVDDEGVEVGHVVALAADVALDEVVGPVVGEDHVGLLVGAADIGAEHDVVLAVGGEVLGVAEGVLGEELQVAAAAVDVLLVLDGVLEDELLVLVAELVGDLGAVDVEARVLRGLEALALLGVGVELPGAELHLALRVALEGRPDPTLLPGVTVLERLLEVDCRSREGEDGKNKVENTSHVFLVYFVHLKNYYDDF